MITRTILPFCLALAGIAASSTAQTVQLSDANMVFTWSGTSFISGFSLVGADGSACDNADNLFAWHWCYALDGGAGQTLDENGHGNYLVAPSGSTQATQTITDVDGHGAFDATVVDVVRSTGSDAGYVEHDLTLISTSSGPINLKVYLFVDADYNGVPSNTTLPGSGPDRFLISAPTSTCGGCFEITADSPDHYGVGAFNDPNRPELRIVAGNDLSDNGLPFGPADFTGAFQWNVSLIPGAQRTLRATTGHNDVFVGQPGGVTYFGNTVGGASGPPTLTTGQTPVLGQPLDIVVGNGGSASSTTLLFGGASQSATVPNCAGLTVGFSLILASVPLPLTGGSASLTLDASTCDTTILGIDFLWQAFVIDQTSPACFPLIHSDVMVVRYGD